MKLYRLYQIIVIIMVAFIGISFYYNIIQKPESHLSYSSFTIELNCTLPPTPKDMKIISIGEGTASEREILELAAGLFQMDNPTITYEENSFILKQGSKTLRFYNTDFIRYSDESFEREKTPKTNLPLLSVKGPDVAAPSGDLSTFIL